MQTCIIDRKECYNDKTIIVIVLVCTIASSSPIEFKTFEFHNIIVFVLQATIQSIMVKHYVYVYLFNEFYNFSLILLISIRQ